MRRYTLAAASERLKAEKTETEIFILRNGSCSFYFSCLSERFISVTPTNNHSFVILSGQVNLRYFLSTISHTKFTLLSFFSVLKKEIQNVDS